LVFFWINIPHYYGIKYANDPSASLYQPGKDIISILEKVLSGEFNASIVTAPSITQIPHQLFDKQRKTVEIECYVTMAVKPIYSR
jgi:hypothetical protein